MKKLLKLNLLALAFVLSACSNEDKEEVVETPVVDMNVVALKGPTAMGMVNLMEDARLGEISDINYDFSIITDISEVPALLVKKEADIAAIPANLASVLFNNTEGEVEVLAINTLGVLYVLETGNTINSVQDLKGKTIYATGKGATPEYALSYILEENGIKDTDLNIEWKSESAEVLASLNADENAVALLPEPFISVAKSKNPDLRVALDLTKEWEKVSTDSMMITGVVVARSEFINENPEGVEMFLDSYEMSVNEMNDDVENGAKLVGKYEIVEESIALKAIPNANITYIDGSEMQTVLSAYLEVLYNQNPKSVGGALPTKDFYYGN